MQPTNTTPEILRPTQADYNVLEKFTRHGVLPPGLQYVTRDDIVVCNITQGVTARQVLISLRVLDPSGQVIPHLAQFTPIALTPVVNPVNITGVEGFVLSASVQCPSAQRGDCYVSIVIQRGQGTSDLTLGSVLLAGYVTGFSPLGYPQSQNEDSLNGRGLMRSILPGNPAAGADFQISVPSGAHWIFQAFRAKLTASATVATRVPRLELTDGSGNVFLLVPNNVNNVTASGSQTQDWGNTLYPAFDGTGNEIGMVMPSIRLAPGWQIKTNTAAIQAGDQWTLGVLCVEQFIGN
jgi:hypothetical protein